MPEASDTADPTSAPKRDGRRAVLSPTFWAMMAVAGTCLAGAALMSAASLHDHRGPEARSGRGAP